MLNGGREEEKVTGPNRFGPGAADYFAVATEKIVDLLDVRVDVASVGSAGRDTIAQDELQAALEREGGAVEDASNFEITSRVSFVD